jgi:hypothetical protein
MSTIPDHGDSFSETLEIRVILIWLIAREHFVVDSCKRAMILRILTECKTPESNDS